jgi:hypothetical protein
MQFALSPYSKRLVSGVHLAASATTADLLLRSTILSQPATVLRRWAATTIVGLPARLRAALQAALLQ